MQQRDNLSRPDYWYSDQGNRLRALCCKDSLYRPILEQNHFLNGETSLRRKYSRRILCRASCSSRGSHCKVPATSRGLHDSRFFHLEDLASFHHTASSHCREH